MLHSFVILWFAAVVAATAKPQYYEEGSGYGGYDGYGGYSDYEMVYSTVYSTVYMDSYCPCTAPYVESTTCLDDLTTATYAPTTFETSVLGTLATTTSAAAAAATSGGCPTPLLALNAECDQNGLDDCCGTGLACNASTGTCLADDSGSGGASTTSAAAAAAASSDGCALPLIALNQNCEADNACCEGDLVCDANSNTCVAS